ncbi:putative lipoprotein [Hyalangium minutum]|uniref:Putative lipoprotein n=2 Tax=Hyalangium minutum TaxID=394096 RepID=A0A085WWX4_9BACT|nr:putative lipoprotein [Hyalangium minutum]
MKLWRCLFLLGALVGLAGCPDTPCVADAPSVGSSGSTPTMVLVGEQVNVRFAPSIAPDCGSSEPQQLPSSLSVEVYGPDNQLVASETVFTSNSRSSATVKFRPEKPGRYHVFAAFAPIGGIHQFDLYAARDRISESTAFILPKLCNALERTQHGGWMCDLDFIRDSALKQNFSDGRMAVAGNVVWVAGNSQVRRYVDTGVELELTASLPSNLGNAQFLLATETELLSLRGLTIERVVYDGTAALSVPGQVQLPSTSGMVGTTGLSALMVRSGDRLGIVTNAPSGGVIQPMNSFTSQICTYQIEPSRIVRTADPCQTFSGNVVGYEPGGLWAGIQSFVGGQLDELRWLEWTEAGISQQASLPLGFNFTVSTQPIGPRNWVVPVITTGGGVPVRTRSVVATYSPERRTILLELLDTELVAPYASGALMWTNPNATGLSARVRVRPTAP